MVDTQIKPVWPEAHCVDQAGLELAEVHLNVGMKVNVTTLSTACVFLGN